MEQFSIGKHDFYLNKKKFQILSGAIHYFRIHPSDWQNSLHNLKALGFNTVETYIPWNVHEQKEGQFNFTEGTDLKKFIELAQHEGLYMEEHLAMSQQKCFFRGVISSCIQE